ncbi:TRAP transporter substrate-binding protein [Fusibacter ferrireducens]|uniref:TRAP transporter substrate-binding protein n=1 Tax=Fusibacter ferrireducens TaxID=2785058 RepID=A0ABS0A0L7_9FIRM|nr:TRAP transporter substrate-binding protein [Fusibacter ferrireducens]MBF4695791.1 TRAP transporter substrate-binding protein [Fusibacter ferrireducens]
MKKLMSLLLVLVLTFGLVGCGAKASDAPAAAPAQNSESNESAKPAEPVKLQIALSAQESSPGAVTAVKLKEILEAKSNGNFQVDVYPNAQLGGDRELIESTQAGSISMSSLTTAPMVSFIPDLAVFDMPMALTDLEMARKVLDGPFRDQIAAKYEAAGFKLLMISPDSFREMSSNIPVAGFEDFKGIDIRTMENKYHMAFWQNLGANPSPLAFSELYIALQQGLVDAQENPYATLVASKLYEQQKYVVNTNHIMFIATTVMNKDLYDGLSEEQKTVLNEACAEAQEFGIEEGKRQAAASVEFLKEQGVEIIDLSPEVIGQMKEAAEPVYDMIRQDIGEELVNSLLDALDKAQ